MFKQIIFTCNIVFLCLSLNIHNVRADAKAEIKKQSPSFRILILGDSLTEGYGLAKKDAFPAVLERLLNQKENKFKVVAAGSSGSTTASAYKRLKWHLKKKPDILILALGANDGLRGIKPEATKANLEKAIDLSESKGVRVVLAGMKIPMNYGEGYRKKFEESYTSLAKKHKLSFVPFLLKNVGGVKSLNLSDGIHPNEKGHKIIGKALYKHMQEIL